MSYTPPAGLTYSTVEDVSRALDIKYTARAVPDIRRALASATLSVESQLHRSFYPWTGTRYKDWPGGQHSRSWILRLDRDELASLTTLVAGGVTISSSDYLLEPANSGPPYTRIEIDLSSSAAFASDDTHQRAIVLTGVFAGAEVVEETAATLAEALDASETGVDVSDSSVVGVGDLIRVDSERMIVTAKSMLDTGQNCTALTAATNDQTITGITAGTIAVGETILVDAERMLVQDIAGTTVTVQRAYDGTTLAAHTNGADIYAPRTLTVTRGQLGTTAATHTTSTAVMRHVYPALVRELCTAEAVNTMEQRRSAYARTIGSGENVRETGGRGLRQIRDDAYTAHGRKARKRVV